MGRPSYLSHLHPAFCAARHNDLRRSARRHPLRPKHAPPPWRFYLESGIVGIAAISGFLVRFHPSAYNLHQSLRDSIPCNVFSLIATTATSFVFLRWLRRQQVAGLEL